MNNGAPNKDEMLLDATELRMRAEQVTDAVKAAKVPIVAMLAEWKEWAAVQNREAGVLREQASTLERRADELFPDPNAQHATISLI